MKKEKKKKRKLKKNEKKRKNIKANEKRRKEKLEVKHRSPRHQIPSFDKKSLLSRYALPKGVATFN